MLLGTIGFQMLLFYLVNWPHKDIRRYAWGVISSTISIFCAVMIFQGFHGVVKEYVIDRWEGSWMWEVLVDMIQLVVWLTALQVVLALSSGAVYELFSGGAPSKEQAELNSKSWSVLFSHSASFAAINAWGSLQQRAFPESPSSTLLIVPVGLAGLFSMYHGYGAVRERVAHMHGGRKDEFEVLWDKETESAEHDVAGLSLAFCTVQSLRYGISGVLPNEEGAESWEEISTHGGRQWQVLLGMGAVFVVLSLAPVLLEGRLHAALQGRSEATRAKLLRAVDIADSYCTYGSAWAFFFGVTWALASCKFTSDSALLFVVLSLFLSAFAFACIFFLNCVQDHYVIEQERELADAALTKMINALGVLVGFSWQQSFQTALTVAATSVEATCPRSVAKLLLSILLVAIVFPAWRMYILRTDREHDAAASSEDQMALRTVIEEHRELMLSPEVDESALDMAHLRMKEHRRRAYDTGHGVGYVPPGLKHLRITQDGVEEVECPSPEAAEGERAHPEDRP